MYNASSGSKMWRWFLLNTRVSVTSNSTLLTYGLLQFYCVESIDDTLYIKSAQRYLIV